MSMTGSVLVGAALFGQNLYNSWRPRKVGVYGTSMVGKTTLDRYMTTPGEMEDIPEDERTTATHEEPHVHDNEMAFQAAYTTWSESAGLEFI